MDQSGRKHSIGLDVLKSFFKTNTLADFQIKSFNHFLNFTLKNIIENEPPLVIRDGTNKVRYKIKFSNVHVSKPSWIYETKQKLLYPHEARLRNLTYSSFVKVNVIEQKINYSQNINTVFKEFLEKKEGEYLCEIKDKSCSNICVKDQKGSWLCLHCLIKKYRVPAENKITFLCENKYCKNKIRSRCFRGKHTLNKFYCSACEKLSLLKKLPGGEKIVFNDESGFSQEEKVYHRINLTKIPIMLGSDRCNLKNLNKEERTSIAHECSLDYGGYFVVKGTERIITSQIRNAYNKILVYNHKNNMICDIRSMSEKTKHSVCFKITYNTHKHNFFVTLPHIRKEICLGYLMSTLECINDMDVSLKSYFNKHIKRTNKNKDYISLIFDPSYYCADEAEDYVEYFSTFIQQGKLIRTNKKDYIINILKNKLFPHLGIDTSFKVKFNFIILMIHKLINTLTGQRKPDERDSYSNKRIETVGVLVGDLFSILFKKFLISARKYISKRKYKNNIVDFIESDHSIQNTLHTAFATGTWGHHKNSYVRTGVSQVLNRLTYISYLSYLKRILLPIGKEGKNIDIRLIHSSQFGYICPTDTPEGQSSGTVLNFSILTDVSISSDPLLIHTIVRSYLEPELILTHSLVFVNGKLIGSLKNPQKLFRNLKELQRMNHIYYDVSITFDETDNELHIWCDEGRCIRPLLTVDQKTNQLKLKNCKQKWDWDYLFQNNYIEYIDCTETQYSVIATYPDDITKHTDFCEIHPTVLLGITGNTIPFPNHNPSPRNTYQCSMVKQSLGLPLLNYNRRADTSTKILSYNQRPIVNTTVSECLGLNEFPSGLNVVVAIMTYTGYNQEDSIIFNKGSIEKGLFVCTGRRTIVAQSCKLNPLAEDLIEYPDPKKMRRKYGDYSKLDKKTGIIKPFTICIDKHGNQYKEPTYVKRGDIIVGKVIHLFSRDGTCSFQDNSVIVGKNEEGYIDNIFELIDKDGYKLVKVIVRKTRIPEIGDKFASRSAQKGVIGMIYDQCDMPFTQDGITPDIIINPHAIPSRMTINQLMETVMGKACSLLGTYGDATAFEHENPVDTIISSLEHAGLKYNKPYDSTGWETFRNGFTGKEYKSKVFIGPTFYQRLKHMVSDKMYARTTGTYTTYMRQPAEGRSRDGGLKFGEMEKDCMISHGTPLFLKEKLFYNSDTFQITVCNQCGQIATSNHRCNICNSDVSTCDIPYASKVMVHGLNSMGIKLKFTPTAF